MVQLKNIFIKKNYSKRSWPMILKRIQSLFRKRLYFTFLKCIDLFFPSLLCSTQEQAICPLFQQPLLLNLMPYSTLLKQNFHHYIRHEFKLLCPNRIKICHAMTAAGIETIIYPTDLFIGNIITKINFRNRNIACKIRNNISKSYQPIDWHIDFRSGYHWQEKTWYRDIKIGEKPGSDIKMPWELSRLQHLPQLALAYYLSRQESTGFFIPDKYSEEFSNQILDFISMNPPRFGVCWACPMDVAIRLVNIIAAYDLFCHAGANFNDQLKTVVISSIRSHAKHIMDNLEWASTGRGNHYLCNIIGLIYAGAWLPSDAETRRWLDFGAQELIKETMLQFNPDGSNVEGSTCYHRLSAEAVIWATAVLLRMIEKDNDSISKLITNEFIERLYRLIHFPLAITKPDGTVPQIGDNDNGRLFKFLPTDDEVLDIELRHQNVWELGQALWSGDNENNNPEADILKKLALGKTIVNLFSNRNIPIINDNNYPNRFHLAYTNELKPSVTAFPDFGLYIFRTKKLYVSIRCGGGGWYTAGNHTHNDQLSFDLCVLNKRIFIDPGTYVYTSLPARRNKFRSTEMHNTLSLDNLQQNEILTDRHNLFRLFNTSNAKVLGYGDNWLTGEHYGFGLGHRREFKIENECLIGEDQCYVPGPREIFFHLDPSVKASLSHNGVKLNVEDLELNMQSISGMQEGEWCITPGEVSFAYGHIVPTSVIKWRGLAPAITWSIGLGDM